MKINLRPLESIKPYDQNPRRNDRAVDAVVASIREFGFRQPIVVDSDGVIIIGHTRWKAARQIGLAKVPVHVATDLTAEQIKAYRIADNKTAEIAEWDFELLPLELSDLRSCNYDLGLLGFDQAELAKLLAAGEVTGLCDPDEVPEPPAEANTKPGDLWILGNHRLLCGDSSSAADVDRLVAGEEIHLVNTDPPYNVAVKPRSNNAKALVGKKRPTDKSLRPKDRPIENDSLSDTDFAKLLDAWFGNIGRVLVPGGAFYCWGGYRNCAIYPAALSRAGLRFSQAIIWVKEHPVVSWSDFMGNHEWCFYGWRGGAKHRWFGPSNATDVWSVKKVNPQSMVHLTEKPVELASRAMQYSSRDGENVLDLFGGSGSTLIAGEQTGRRIFLMELDGLYCDVIVARWEKFTARKATLETVAGDGVRIRNRRRRR